MTFMCYTHAATKLWNQIIKFAQAVNLRHLKAFKTQTRQAIVQFCALVLCSRVERKNEILEFRLGLKSCFSSSR